MIFLLPNDLVRSLSPMPHWNSFAILHYLLIFPRLIPQCRPSVEEVRTWAKSFDKLMRSSGECLADLHISAGWWTRISAGGRKLFREFLRCEYSEENILFWLACEELKQETNPEAIEEKARYIYEDYISILSPKEVRLRCDDVKSWKTQFSSLSPGIIRLSCSRNS